MKTKLVNLTAKEVELMKWLLDAATDYWSGEMIPYCPLTEDFQPKLIKLDGVEVHKLEVPPTRIYS